MCVTIFLKLPCVKLPICDNFIERKTLQREYASATIAKLIELIK